SGWSRLRVAQRTRFWKSSLRVSFSSCSSRSTLISRRSAISLVRLMAVSLRVTLHDEAGLDRQLVRGEAHRFPGERLGHARHLEPDPARLDHPPPAPRRPLAP